jgi:SAM-dependent methyltransferase
MIDNGIGFLTRVTPQFCQNLERCVSASLSLLDRAVDLVICLNALHHLEDPVPFFNEVARVLKEGGKFVIMDLRRDAPKVLAVFFNFMRRLVIREKRARGGLWNSLNASFTLEECKRMLRRSILPPWRIYHHAIELWIESH